MKAVDARWEKRNLGIDVAEVRLEAAGDLAELAESLDGLVSSYDYLVVKCNTGSADALFGLDGLGFTFVEAQLSLRYSVDDDAVLPSIREVADEMLEGHALVDVTDDADCLEWLYRQLREKSTFTTDRIHLDPAFAPNLTGERYAGWTRDLVEQGARVLFHVHGGARIGFTVYKQRTDRRFESFLGGCFRHSEDHAMNTPFTNRLLFGYLAARGMRVLDTWVSSNNKPVVRFHLASGYQLRNIHYVYVMHTERAEGAA